MHGPSVGDGVRPRHRHRGGAVGEPRDSDRDEDASAVNALPGVERGEDVVRDEVASSLHRSRAREVRERRGGVRRREGDARVVQGNLEVQAKTRPRGDADAAGEDGVLRERGGEGGAEGLRVDRAVVHERPVHDQSAHAQRAVERGERKGRRGRRGDGFPARGRHHRRGAPRARPPRAARIVRGPREARPHVASRSRGANARGPECARRREGARVGRYFHSVRAGGPRLFKNRLFGSANDSFSRRIRPSPPRPLPSPLPPHPCLHLLHGTAWAFIFRVTSVALSADSCISISFSPLAPGSYFM